MDCLLVGLDVRHFPKCIASGYLEYLTRHESPVLSTMAYKIKRLINSDQVKRSH